MTDRKEQGDRRAVSPEEAGRAERVLRLAWMSLPGPHRQLLEAIGASQWQVVDEPLGGIVRVMPISG